MSQPERTESGKVTLEDLLRVKRAERPSPEFWVRFDQELRAKQLAAAIEKRPWWIALRLPQLARVIARYQLPLGATAVLALSVVAVREFRPADPLAPVPTAAPETLIAKTAPVAAAAGETLLATSDPLRSTTLLHTVESSSDAAVHVARVSEPTTLVSAAAESVASDTPASRVSTGPGALTAMIPWAPQMVASEEARPAIGELSHVQFAHVIAPARYADFSTKELDLPPLVMPARSPAVAPAETVVAAAAPSAPAVAPTAPAAVRVAAVAASAVNRREIRRDRILSDIVVAENTGGSERSRFAQVREVIASTLDEDTFSGGVRRLGMGGDRVTLKF